MHLARELTCWARLTAGLEAAAAWPAEVNARVRRAEVVRTDATPLGAWAPQAALERVADLAKMADICMEVGGHTEAR